MWRRRSYTLVRRRSPRSARRFHPRLRAGWVERRFSLRRNIGGHITGLMHWPGPAYKTMNRRKDVMEEHGPWHYATTSEDEMPALRAETWRAMEHALATGKAIADLPP